MTIDLTRARELLAQAVQTQGRDFVYNPGGYRSCYYTPVAGTDAAGPTDPRVRTGCLIGVALSLAGVTRHLEAGFRNVGIYAFSLQSPGLMTERAALYLSEAQREQDRGRTWGEAFDIAEQFSAILSGTDTGIE